LEKGQQEKDFHEKTIMQILKEKLEFICTQTGTEYYSVMARVLSDLGDVCFSEEMCNDCWHKLFISYKTCPLFDSFYGCFDKKKSPYFWTHWYELFYFKIELIELDSFLNSCALEENLLNNVELALFLYSLSMKFYEKANLYKQSAFQITKILTCFKFCLKRRIKMYNNEIRDFCKKDKDNLKYITNKAIEFLHMANDGLDEFEVLKRKEDFGRKAELQYIQVDSEIIRINVVEKEVELYLSIDNSEPANKNTLKELYGNYIISSYHINYSVPARVRQLSLKAKLNRETYNIIKKYDYKWEASKIFEIFSDDANMIKKFDKISEEYKPFALLEMLVADSIFCYTKILRLIQTSNDSYIFNHSFFAEIYRRLADWTEIYEVFKHIRVGEDDNEQFKEAKKRMNISPNIQNNLKKYFSTHAKIDNYLADLLGEDFKEQLSIRYYRQMAFLHYQRLKETHTGGSAYFNLLEQMYFIRGDYDDIVSHFYVAGERFMINKTNCYEDNVKKLKEMNEKSSLYKSENYFEKI